MALVVEYDFKVILPSIRGSYSITDHHFPRFPVHQTPNPIYLYFPYHHHVNLFPSTCAFIEVYLSRAEWLP